MQGGNPHRFTAILIAPAENRRTCDHGRYNPHQQDHHSREKLRSVRRVGQRLRDGHVPIDGYAGEIEDTRRAQQHVGRHPQITKNQAEFPRTIALVTVDAQRKNEDRYESVGERQRGDEVVGDRLQSTRAEKGADDQQVAEECADIDEDHARESKESKPNRHGLYDGCAVVEGRIGLVRKRSMRRTNSC